MFKVPFKTISLEIDRFISKMVMALDWSQSFYWWEQYNIYLESCGWSDFEIDQELLKIIDESWEINSVN